MIDYIQKGGLLMWPILACSVIAIAVFAERLFYLHRATIHVGEFLQGLSSADATGVRGAWSKSLLLQVALWSRSYTATEDW